MKRSQKKKLAAAVLVGVPALLLGRAAKAGTYNWSNSDSDGLWPEVGNWIQNSGYPSTTSDTAIFGTTGSGTVSLGGTAQTLLNLTYTNSAVGFNLGVTSGDTLNFASGAIISATSGASQTISANIVLNGSMTISNLISAGKVLDFAGVISGAYYINAIAKSTDGAYEFDGQNTFSGGFNIPNGPVYLIGSSSIYSGTTITSGPLGTGTVTSTNQPTFEAFGADRTIANPFNLIVSGQGFTVGNAASAHNLTLAGAISYTGKQQINVYTPGQSFFLGAASSPSTVTLPNATSSNLTFDGTSGSTIVLNDVIEDANPATPQVTVFYNNYNNGGSNNTNPGYTIQANAPSTYGGGTQFSGSNGVYQLGISTASSGTTVASGPFGTGTITFVNAGGLTTIEPFGADRTIANSIVMNGGFFAANASLTADLTGPHNLTLSGPISIGGTLGRYINNNMVAGESLTLGLAGTNASTITLGNATADDNLSIQSQPAAGVGGGITIINDVLQDGGGTQVVGLLNLQMGGTIYLNAVNTWSGGLEFQGTTGATLVVSSDANMGATNGGITFIGAGTLLATGTFTTARSINLGTNTGASGGVIDVSSGQTLTLIGGVGNTGDLTKGTNVGTLQLAQPSGYTFSGNVNALGGTLAFGTNGGSIGPVNVPGALNVSDGAVTQFLPSTTAHVLNTVNTLNLNNTGLLDFGNSDLSVNNSLSQVRSYLAQAYAGGAWTGTSGITSSVVEANPSALSIAYVSGANTNNAALNPALTNTSAVLLRPSLIGDFNLDGKVDRFDIRQFNARNAFNDGLTTHDWADGDLNGDGKVDRFDIRILNASNNFNSGNTFVAQAQAQAQTQTLSSSVSPATGNSINNPTTVGTVGDGKPDLIYNPSTGDVVFSYDGYNPGTGKELVEIDVQSSKSDLNPSGANTSAAQFVSKASNDVDYQDVGTGIVDGVDLGTIMPVGSTPAALTNGDIVVNLYLNGEGTSNKYADITSTPEPTTLSLMGLAAAGLLGRRRKNKREL